MANTRKPGRRPGDPAATRSTILAAALRVFASVGYERATIRSIAAAADVDPALVVHHFGNKQSLFAAVHHGNTATNQTVPVPARPPVDAIARHHLMSFATAGTREQSLLRSAATNAQAGEILRELVHGSIDMNARTVDTASPEQLALVESFLLGVAFARQIVGIWPLADMTPEGLAAAVSPIVEHILTGTPGAV